MNDFQIFTYRNEQVRTIQQPDGLWWVLRDVCQILGLSNPTVVASRLEDDERTKFNLGRQGEATIINEPGLYAVILRSDKPEAKDFKRWVTHEVLPSIRKNGGYIAGQETMSDAELMAKALEVARRTLANKQAQIEHMQPKAVFADAVCASNTTILVGELAKILRQNGVNMGEKRLFDWLRQNGYLVRRNGTDRNMPTQRSMEQGLFVIKETTVCHSDGHTTISKTPKITGKGQQYFVNIFLRKDVEREKVNK